jgi:hypothetical protein
MNDVTMRPDTSLYAILQNNTQGNDKKLMLSMIKHMSKNMNTIVINGSTLDDIMSDTSMSESSIRNSLSSLSELGLVEKTRLLRAEYIINPVLCYKGSEIDVWKMYAQVEAQRKMK